MPHPFFKQDETIVYDYIKHDLQKKKDTQLGALYVDLDKGGITFIQRWRYNFIAGQVWSQKERKMLKGNSWTDDEEINFHYASSALIWKFFNTSDLLPILPFHDPVVKEIIKLLNSNHPTLCYTPVGKGEFARKHAGKKLFVAFDIAISRSRPHFTVVVRKMPKDHENGFRPNVDYGARIINLKRADILQSGVQQDGRKPATNNDFYALPHEFGHAIGYEIDEYEVAAAKRSDVTSLMNIGKEIRGRHFKFITQHLNTMFPGTQFMITDANPNG
ncbi:MAG: hypothetical protein ACRCTD_08745 [Beijerinckiaceae bacterium]